MRKAKLNAGMQRVSELKGVMDLPVYLGHPPLREQHSSKGQRSTGGTLSF